MELIRCEPTGVDVPAEELLIAARVSSRRLYAAFAAVLSLNLVFISGALTFWALLYRQ